MRKHVTKKNDWIRLQKYRRRKSPTRRGSAGALSNGMFATSPSVCSQREPRLFLSVAIHALVVAALWHVPRAIGKAGPGIQIVHAGRHETVWLLVSTIAPPSR